MFALFCMLTQVYELLITHLHNFSIHFINILSYNSCIRYLVFHILCQSISMAFIDYTCISSVCECSNSIKLLLESIEVPYYGS